MTDGKKSIILSSEKLYMVIYVFQRKWIKVCTMILLVFATTLMPLPASGANAQTPLAIAPELNEDLLPDNMYLTTKKEYTVATGVYETQFTANNGTASRQNACYALTIDLNGPATILASYKNQDGTTLGMQTVRDQAAAAEKVRGVDVVAAVNADIYNMDTGGTSGVLVMDGEVYNQHGNASPTNGRPYFAIMNDGTAQIRETNDPLDDVKEAVGLWEICVRDGVNVSSPSGSSYEDNGEPRTAIGIKADGSVVILVNDGRQKPYSAGLSWPEIADVMISLGCVTAGHLDGGGSSTFLSQHEGSSELVCRNTPCNGSERNVSTALMIATNYEADGVFDHASIQSEADSCLPGEQMTFTASGTDLAGSAAVLPADGYFYLADDTCGTITADGVFTSNGQAGTVRVLYGNGSTVYGETTFTVEDVDTESSEYIGFVQDEQTGQLRYKYRGRHIVSQWVAVGKDVYYLDSNGHVATGNFTVNEPITPGRSGVSDFLFNGQSATMNYTADNTGRLTKGCVYERGNDTYYIFAGVLQFGWHYYDNNWHFFDGVVKENQYGKLLKGNWTREYRRYICDSEGNLTTGFIYEDEGGIKYLWAGQIVSGWVDVNGVTLGTEANKYKDYEFIQGRFYFDPENGSYRAEDQARINGVTHYFNSDGTLREGVMQTADGTLYLQNGVPAYGWFEVDGETCYFSEENNGYLTITVDEIAAILRQVVDVCKRMLDAMNVFQTALGTNNGEQL